MSETNKTNETPAAPSNQEQAIADEQLNEIAGGGYGLGGIVIVEPPSVRLDSDGYGIGGRSVK